MQGYADNSISGNADHAPTSGAVSASEAEIMPGRGVDTRAWLIWVAAMLIISLTVFSPWYLLLLIIIVIALWPQELPTAEQSGALQLPALRRISLAVLIFGAGFNLIVVRFGNTPLLSLPEWLPILGGTLYLEPMLYGLVNALRVIAILFAFALFSRMVNYADLIRLAPPALFELGLVLSISFTLIPSMRRSLRDIRDAQRLRGHRLRGLRDFPPLIGPLVISGVERSLLLAESMEARGYGGASSTENSARLKPRYQVALLAGLVILLFILGLHTFYPLPAPILWSLLAGAMLFIGVTLRQIATLLGRTRLRHGRWRLTETLVALGAIIPCLIVLFIDRAAVFWNVYQSLNLPTFSPWLAIAFFGLILPLFDGSRPSGSNPR